MNKLKVLTLVLAGLLLFSATGCKGVADKTNSGTSSQKTNSVDESNNEVSTAYGNESFGFQTELPQNGEEVAVLRTSMGDIYIRLFPDGAAKAVENFKALITSGYYDGIIFHRVMNEFMIQGGDPTGTGTGGESIWGGKFADEFSPKLNNFRGALSMANSGSNTNGSQFFIVQAKTVSSQLVSQMTQNEYPEELIEKYKELGGTPWLDFKHTVFGHVYKGLDIVDAIASASVQDSKPIEDIVIKKAELIKYTAE